MNADRVRRPPTAAGMPRTRRADGHTADGMSLGHIFADLASAPVGAESESPLTQ